MYGLPSTVTVNQPLPKNAFYRRLSLSRPVKDEFVNGIEELCVVGSVKESTCGIPAAGGIDEISILRVGLKQPDIPRKALDAIASAVPRKLLMVCSHGDWVQLAVVRKGLQVGARRIVINDFYLMLKGTTLSEVWDGLCAQTMFDDTSVVDVDARMAREKRVSELEAQVIQLERKYAREVQPGRRNTAFKEYRTAMAELSALKGE